MNNKVDAASGTEAFGYKQELKRSLRLSGLLVYISCAIALHATLPGVPKPVWLVAGLALFVGLKLAGRSPAVPVEESRKEP